jgi:hypothetical protein
MAPHTPLISLRRLGARALLVLLVTAAGGVGTALVIAAPTAKLAHQTDSPAEAAIGNDAWGFRFLGEQRLPWRMNFEESVVGGLSGIDYDPKEQRYYLISDDRSEKSPARFYTATIRLDESGLSGVELKSVVPLLRPHGRRYPARPAPDMVDPEAIRYDARSGTLLWTNEGERAVSLFDRFSEPLLVDPSLREARTDGSFMAEFRLPEMFRMTTAESGPRANLTFEGVSLSPDGASVWLSMEGPLLQDGPPVSRTAGALVRMSHQTRSPLSSAALLGQYAYRTDPLPARPLIPGLIAELGVSEILALSNTRLLVLERSYVLGHGLGVRLFEADIAGATDISNIASLRAAGATVVPMKKRLIFDFASLKLPHLDNIEGMTWGPTLANGKRTLVFVSDDNFSPMQTTQFLAFELTLPRQEKP